jgi:hypothetical protein
VLQALTFFERGEIESSWIREQTEAINAVACALLRGRVTVPWLQARYHECAFEREGHLAGHVRDGLRNRFACRGRRRISLFWKRSSSEEMLIGDRMRCASGLPIVATMTFPPKLSECSDGHSPTTARAMVDAGAAAVGVNCGGT